MDGVNAIYLRVSDVFLYVVGAPFVVSPFFFITFFFIRVQVCVQVYMLRVCCAFLYGVACACVVVLCRRLCVVFYTKIEWKCMVIC